MRDVQLKTFAASVNFNKLTATDIRENGSFNLLDEDGTLVFIAVVPISGFKKNQIESIATSMNMAIGKV